MLFMKAPTFWRRQGRDMSLLSLARRDRLDFQWPVSLSLSSEEFSDDVFGFRRRLRRLSLELELGELSLGTRLCFFWLRFLVPAVLDVLE